jgi:hypothetical protein
VDRDGVPGDIQLGAISKEDMLEKLEKAGYPERNQELRNWNEARPPLLA